MKKYGKKSNPHNVIKKYRGEKAMLISLFIGIIIGVVLMFVASLMKKNEVSKAIIQMYALETMILGVCIAIYGYQIIRGFEGFAYMLLGFPIVIFSLVIYLLNFKKIYSK